MITIGIVANGAFCQLVKEKKGEILFDSNVIGLSHNLYNNNIYVLTQTGFFNQPFMDQVPEMNFSQNYKFNLSPNPILYPPNSTKITTRLEMCVVDNRHLMMFGNTSDPSPANYRFEIQRTNYDKPDEVELVTKFLDESTEYLMHKCNSNEGAFFRSKNDDEELVFLNSMISSAQFFTYKGSATTSRILSVATAHPNFTLSVKSISGDRVRFFVADNESFWEERAGGGIYQGTSLQFGTHLVSIEGRISTDYVYFNTCVRSFQTSQGFTSAVNNWNKGYMHNQVETMGPVTSHYFESIRISLDGTQALLWKGSQLANVFSKVKIFDKIDYFNQTCYLIGTKVNQSIVKLFIIGRQSDGNMYLRPEYDDYNQEISFNSFKVSAERVRRTFFVANENKVLIYILQSDECFGGGTQYFCNTCTEPLNPLRCSSCKDEFEISSPGTVCWRICPSGEFNAKSSWGLPTCQKCSLAIPFCSTCERFYLDIRPRCLLCQGGLTYSATEQTCKCTGFSWRDSTPMCQPNPSNCQIAEDITGECLQCVTGYSKNLLGECEKIIVCSEPRSWVYLNKECRNNAPNCKRATNDVGVCTECDPGYTVDPNNNMMCIIIPCLARQYRDDQDNCINNPPNCAVANDILGTCKQADPGFYITTTQQILACSTVDSRCTRCATPLGNCTLCLSSYSWDSTLRICKRICTAVQGILANNSGCYNCNSIDPSCSSCNDFEQSCKGCISGWKIPTSKVETYLPRICIPECGTGTYVAFEPVGSNLLVCKDCSPNCASCTDFDGICLQCTSSTSFYLDPIEKKCYRRCGASQFRTPANLCQDCPQFCYKCFNNTGNCEQCLPNYHVGLQSLCQKNCEAQQAFSPPDSCLPCKDQNCQVCEDVTLNCNKCTDAYFLFEEPSPSTTKTCKKKCRQGPFSDPLASNYESEKQLTFQALSQNNTCVNCATSCQRCSNETLVCEDQPIEFEVKESSITPPLHELLFEVVFKTQNSTRFDLPKNRDYTFLLKLSSITDSSGTTSPNSQTLLRRLTALTGKLLKTDWDTKINRIGQAAQEPELQIAMRSKWYDNNHTMMGGFSVPKKLRSASQFDVVIESNGLQFMVGPDRIQSYALKQKKIDLTIQNKNIEIPENPYKTKGQFSGISSQAASAVLASTEGLSILGMSAAGSGGFGVIRFTQVLKIYNRLKYIGVYYGETLDAFLVSLGELFPDSEIDLALVDMQRRQEKGSIGKISHFRVYSDLYKAIGLKFYIYIGLSVLALGVEWIGVRCLKDSFLESILSGKTGSHISWLRAINVLRFAQFMAFNLVVIDGFFYSTRILVHTKQYGLNVEKMTLDEGFSLFICFLLFYLLIVDLIRLCSAGQSLKCRDSRFHQDHILERQTQMWQELIQSVCCPEEQSLDESKIKLEPEFQENLKEKDPKKRLRINQVAPLAKQEKNPVNSQQINKPDWRNLVIIDEVNSISNAHINPRHILFAQDSMIAEKNAYDSAFVNSFRFFFLLKTSLFQILLVTLPYSPRIQILMIIGLEVLNVLGTWVKYKAIKHITSKVNLTQNIGQGLILIMFLCLVFAITTKSFKYGNGSTIGSLELGYWQAGQNLGIALVSVAVLAELLLYLAGLVSMIKGILNTLIALCMKESSTSTLITEQIRQQVKYYKMGVFYKTTCIKNETQEVQLLPDLKLKNDDLKKNIQHSEDFQKKRSKSQVLTPLEKDVFRGKEKHTVEIKMKKKRIRMESNPQSLFKSKKANDRDEEDEGKIKKKDKTNHREAELIIL